MGRNGIKDVCLGSNGINGAKRKQEIRGVDESSHRDKIKGRARK
jgi:hypothetical protein